MADIAVGKMNPAGVLWVAPYGTALPGKATDQLDPAFQRVGILDKDGITFAEDNDNTDINDMDGKTVLTVNSSHTETFQFVMLETNKASLQLRFGSTRVTVDQATGAIHYSTGAPSGEKLSIVTDVLMTGNDRKKRTVIEKCSLSKVGDIQEHSSDAISYDVTVTAYENSHGNYTENYIEKIA